VTSADLGSARRGLIAWLIQRVSSLYLAGFALYVLWRVAVAPIRDYAAWKAWTAGGGVRLAVALFWLALLAHAWIGVRSIWMDYMKPPALRFAVSLASGLGLLVLALWAAEIVLRDMRP
jgi:succinate dehydrogenase / fumarate reductase membrane anchor subunit